MAIPSNLLQYNNYYHIYNRGTNSCDLFNEDKDYERFLLLLIKHLSPVVSCYAWVLIKNHFHLVIKTKTEEAILKHQEIHFKKQLPGLFRVYQQFSNLFNAYVKYFNLKYYRTGSLFENRFKRICIENTTYLKQVIIYVHNNPLKHSFCKHPIEYPWSSYISYLSEDPFLVSSNKIKDVFNSKLEFESMHTKKFNKKELYLSDFEE